MFFLASFKEFEGRSVFRTTKATPGLLTPYRIIKTKFFGWLSKFFSYHLSTIIYKSIAFLPLYFSEALYSNGDSMMQDLLLEFCCSINPAANRPVHKNRAKDGVEIGTLLSPLQAWSWLTAVQFSQDDLYIQFLDGVDRQQQEEADAAPFTKHHVNMILLLFRSFPPEFHNVSNSRTRFLNSPDTTNQYSENQGILCFINDVSYPREAQLVKRQYSGFFCETKR